MNKVAFFSEIEKESGFGKKILNLPLKTLLGAGALIYFGPKILNSAMSARTMTNTGSSADSLEDIEAANRKMVEQLQGLQPAAVPKQDTYPYV